MEPIQLYAATATGILAQEALQWYFLRTKLTAAEHRATLKDPAYWMVVAAMLVIGTAAAYFWMADELARYRSRDALLLGLSFPALLRKAIGAANPDKEKPALGVRWTTYLS